MTPSTGRRRVVRRLIVFVVMTVVAAVPSSPAAQADHAGVTIDVLTVDSIEVSTCPGWPAECAIATGTIICTLPPPPSSPYEGTLRVYLRRHSGGPIVAGPEYGTFPGRFCTGEVETWATEVYPRLGGANCSSEQPGCRIRPGRYEAFVFADMYFDLSDGETDGDLDTLTTVVRVRPH